MDFFPDLREQEAGDAADSQQPPVTTELQKMV